MSDLISREHMKSLGATCIASRSKDGNMFPIVSIDELPPADPTHEPPSNTLGALDCVSRQEAIDAVSGGMCSGWDCDVIDKLKALPSVQPDKDLIHLQKEQAYMQGYEDGQKSRKGKWKIYAIFDDCYYAKCNQCHETQVFYYNKPLTNFCPDCGADMREGGEE